MIKGVMAACVAACVYLSAMPGAAAYISGNELHEMCAKDAGIDFSLSCTLYVLGVADTMRVMSRVTTPIANFKHICVPSGATSGQLTDVAIKYLRDHPEKRHLGAMVLVINAIREAFPCPAAD